MMRRSFVVFFVLLVGLSPGSCGTDTNSTAPPGSGSATISAATGDGESGDTPAESSPTAGSERATESTSHTSGEAQGSLLLRADGLGIVSFGQPKDEVIGILGELIGTSPTDPWSEAGWVEFIGWKDLGLYVGFDTPQSSDYTGVSRFVGWDAWPPNALRLTTDEGIGIGSTVSEARSAYGDRFQVPLEPDECIGDSTYLLTSPGGDVELFGTLDRPPADDAQIVTLHAGVGVGC